MTSARVLQKGVENSGMLYIFGGDSTATIEKANILTREWEWEEFTNHPSFTEFVSVEQIEKFSQAQPLLAVDFKKNNNPAEQAMRNPVPQNQQRSEDMVLLFGTDSEPLIFEFNLTNNTVINHPVPLTMRLYSYQAGVRVSPYEFILVGGIQDQMDLISNKSFDYNIKTKIAQRLANMKQDRYTFNCLMREGKVYVIGGRTYGEDNVALLKSCERYDPDKENWEDIAPLNQERCSAMSFVINSSIFIAGGYKGNGVRCETIERYIDKSNTWITIPLRLKEPVESAIVEVLTDSGGKFLIIGGRSPLGDSKKVFLYEFDKDLRDGRCSEVGNLDTPRSLHKFWKFKNQGKYNDMGLIFGGGEDPQSLECFSLRKFKMEEGDESLRKRIEEYKFELGITIGDIELKKFLLV